MPPVDPPLSSAAAITRHPEPVLTPEDIPYPSGMVFNAGVARLPNKGFGDRGGQYVMVFRNDVGSEGQKVDGTKTSLGLAWSDDGIAWDVEPEPCWKVRTDEIRRVYDPRLTVVDHPGPRGREFECLICFAMDTEHGVRGGVATCSPDFREFGIKSISVPDNRNMVIFPEQIELDGQKVYARLERPMPVYGRHGRDRFDTWLSTSPDLVHWGNSKLVLGVEHVPWADDKIGPGAPPIKTDRGWLTTFHGVDRDDDNRGKNGWEAKWTKRYAAGLMLLDLDRPWEVVGMCKTPLIAPETEWETSRGFRHNVIFPGGMIAEPDGTVKIYYGASDTVECLATAKIDDLLDLCEPV